MDELASHFAATSEVTPSTPGIRANCMSLWLKRTARGEARSARIRLATCLNVQPRGGLGVSSPSTL